MNTTPMGRVVFTTPAASSVPEGFTLRQWTHPQQPLPFRVVYGFGRFDWHDVQPGFAATFIATRGRWQRVESPEEHVRRLRNEKRLARGWRPRHVRASV